MINFSFSLVLQKPLKSRSKKMNGEEGEKKVKEHRLTITV